MDALTAYIQKVWAKEFDEVFGDAINDIAKGYPEGEKQLFKAFCARKALRAIDRFVIDGIQGITSDQLAIVTALGYVKGQAETQ